MDSGRKALLEKARELGTLAQNMTFQDFLDKSVTYRTLALYLGVETLWWSEFWRSFSYAVSRRKRKPKSRTYRFCGTVRDVTFAVKFLALWFGAAARIADIPEEEFYRVYHLIMRD